MPGAITYPLCRALPQPARTTGAPPCRWAPGRCPAEGAVGSRTHARPVLRAVPVGRLHHPRFEDAARDLMRRVGRRNAVRFGDRPILNRPRPGPHTGAAVHIGRQLR